MGRVRAAIEFKRSRPGEAATKALAEAAARDPFWGVRIEAVKSLAEMNNDSSRAALAEAARDKDPRVRREAIKGLAAFNDPNLAGLFIGVINTDQSYFAIAEAAHALGATGSARAFDVLMSALKVESWQQTVRAGVLGGLAALKDPRALEAGLKYAAPGNPTGLRAAAFRLLVEVGKTNDQAFQALVSAMKENSTQTRILAAQALGALGDPRAIPALEELTRAPDFTGPGQIRDMIERLINQLKNKKKDDQQKKGP